MSKQDMCSVLNEAIALAMFLLQKNGEFHPFAVVLTRQGEMRHKQAWTQHCSSSADQIRELLRSGLRRYGLQEAYRATAVVSDTRLRPIDGGSSRDAIRVEIEDAAEPPVTCYLPYMFDSGQVRPGEIMAERGKAFIFKEIWA